MSGADKCLAIIVVTICAVVAGSPWAWGAATVAIAAIAFSPGANHDR